MKKVLCILMTVVMLAISVYACAETFAAGTYTGVGKGNNGSVEVTVTFTNERIESVEIAAHKETAGICENAMERIPAAIVDTQSIDVDTVSGATNTSRAIIEAVNDAIRQAGADPDALVAQKVTYEKDLTAGTYTATVHGHHSDITMEVVVTENAIVEINVLEEGETLNLSDGAFTTIPADMIAYQTVNVDTITGATYSSAAVIQAVTNCLQQAGGENAVKAFSAKAPEKVASTEEHVIDCDVVVAGSGLTGVSAALAAQDAGAKVYLLEKLSFHGGISQTCDAWSIMAREEEDPTGEGLANWLLYRPVAFMDGDTYMDGKLINEAQIRKYAAYADDSIRWLESHGITFNYVDNPKMDMPLVSPMFNQDGLSAPDVTAAAINKLVSDFVENGGVILYNTRAEHVILDEEGKTAGLTATGLDGIYTFNAPAVVLATGGYANGEENIAKYASAYTGENNCTLVSNVGDALTMGEEIGADIYEGMFMMAGSGHSVYTDADMCFPYDDAVSPANSLFVNKMGVRVNSETPSSYTPGVTYVDPDSEDYFWCIINAEQAENTEFLKIFNEQYAAGNEDFIMADSIEELSTKIKVSSRTLHYTLNRYNSFCETGVDEDYGKDAVYLNAMEEGPWYATKQTIVYFGSVGGLVTDENTNVLKNGEVIPGLYAAGEASNGGLFNICYSGCYSVSCAHTLGQIAGENAAAYSAQ